MYLCNSVAPRLNIASTLLSHGYIQGDLTRSTKTKLALIMAELQQNRERSNSSLKGWSFQTTTRIISTRNALATTVVNGVTQQQVFSTLTPQIVTTKEQWGAKLGTNSWEQFRTTTTIFECFKKGKRELKELCILQLSPKQIKSFCKWADFFHLYMPTGTPLLASISLSLLLRKELKSFFAIFRSSGTSPYYPVLQQQTFIFNCVLNLLCHHKVKVTSSNMHVMLICRHEIWKFRGLGPSEVLLLLLQVLKPE